ALEVHKTLWDFCPNLAASYIMMVVFALATVAHVVQAVIYCKPYCWTIAMSGLLQALAYLFRILSIGNPTSLPLYATWFVLILIAPIWTNAFVYMILGRMVWNYTKAGKLLGLSAWRLGQFFVVLDIIAAVVQAYGAATASDITSSTDVILRGLHTYMAGIGVQQFFICVFFLFAICFHKEIGGSAPRNALLLLYCLYFTVILISVRICFRLVEYAGGLDSSIPRHEAYQYCFDSLLMLIASCIFNIVHPGRIMAGKQGDLPNKSARKLRAMGSEVREGSISLSNPENSDA
ncbi:RTA1 like protein-domain-containing protein, partial [Ilyonectria robusta]|uniref:RTA1 like protein-domain-containing protein n=1 Tax=Ilyonectria robusta TaxID=1079257 RepID=UPI001E8DDEB6